MRHRSQEAKRARARALLRESHAEGRLTLESGSRTICHYFSSALQSGAECGERVSRSEEAEKRGGHSSKTALYIELETVRRSLVNYAARVPSNPPVGIHTYSWSTRAGQRSLLQEIALRGSVASLGMHGSTAGTNLRPRSGPSNLLPIHLLPIMILLFLSLVSRDRNRVFILLLNV